MKVVLAGGTGFLGRALVEHLAQRGHEVVVLSRSGPAAGPAGSRRVDWQPDGAAGPWAREVDGADAIVNLAGAGIADRRWSAARKEELRVSRVTSTRSLVSAVRAAAHRPAVFVQGSAIGFYGVAGDEPLDESFPPGDDFLGTLCIAWEAEAHPIEALGCRLAVIRTGIVLAKDGGALPQMAMPFRFFVGGPIANGRQFMSWIHRDDWLRLVCWTMETPAIEGVFNATAPHPVTNAEFSQALGRALHRPSWFPVPGFALRVLFGEFATHGLVGGQRVVPKRALDAGFTFTYPELGPALTSALG